jgi:hypothetical protein
MRPTFKAGDRVRTVEGFQRLGNYKPAFKGKTLEVHSAKEQA